MRAEATIASIWHAPLAAKAVSVTLATLFTYLGSRFWTFREPDPATVTVFRPVNTPEVGATADTTGGATKV